MSEVIYLACPLTTDDPEVKHHRIYTSAMVARHLRSLGAEVFAPISDLQTLIRSLPSVKGHDFWMSVDFLFLEKCNKMMVITLPGWEKSKGVEMEMKRMTERGVPIELLDPEVFLAFAR
jgi:uncharacterized protein DUF1937